MSPGLTPEEVMRMRTSPAPGTGSGISSTISTSRAGPCLSYQAALICKLRSFEVSQAATLLVREFFANTGRDSICNGGALPGNRLFRRLADSYIRRSSGTLALGPCCDLSFSRDQTPFDHHRPQ